MKFLFLTKYGRLGASSRLRSYQYLPSFESQGVECTVAPLLGDDYVTNLYQRKPQDKRSILNSCLRRKSILKSVDRYDLVWVEKEALPWMPYSLESALYAAGVPVIADYDDAIFHHYDQSPNPIARALLKNKIAEVMRHASVVIAGNPYIASYAEQAGARLVQIIPTVVDLNQYSVIPPPTDVFTVGWIGTPSTIRYLSLIRDALCSLQQQFNIRIITVGAEVQLGGVATEYRPWSEETEAEAISSFSVGVMPLPDEPFERGKCAYKLIQYMASGRPVIASPVGVNAQLIDRSVGFLANSTSDWITSVTALLKDRDMTVRMGQFGRLKVETDYSLQTVAPRLLSLMQATLRPVP